jgi:hypothetical protein
LGTPWEHAIEIKRLKMFTILHLSPKSSTKTILLFKQLVNPNRVGSQKDMTPPNNTNGLYHAHMKKKKPY